MLPQYTTLMVGQGTKLEMDQGSTGLTLKCYVIELKITLRLKELDSIMAAAPT
jgi:hypothetical protein